MNAAGLTLLWPGLEADTADYTVSMDDEPTEEEYAYRARRNREAIKKRLAELKAQANTDQSKYIRP